MANKMNYIESTIDYYNKYANDFISSTFNASMDMHYQKFISYIPNDASILDFGCGTGRDSLYFLKKGYSVLSTDGSQKMVNFTSNLTGVPAKKLLFHNINYTDNFDGVWACASLLHLKKDLLQSILYSLSVALRKNGILYSSFKYGDFCGYINERYFTYLTEKDIDFFCSEKTGLKIEEYYISKDVRSEYANQKWINIISSKRQ